MARHHASEWQRWIRYGYLALVTGAFVYALIAQREWLFYGAEQLTAFAIAKSILFATIGVACSGMIWLSIIRGLGASITAPAGLHLFFVTQLGKYLPGSLWPVMMQADLAREHAIPVRVAVTAQVLFMWVHVMTATMTGSLAFASVYSPFQSQGMVLTTIAASPLVLILLHPGITDRIINTLLRLMKRDPLPQRLSGWAMVKAVGWSVLMWLAYGAHLWVLTDLMTSHGWIYIPALDFITNTSIFALAWVAGFVMVIAPAGLGVREAVLIGAIPNASVGMITAVSRIAMTVADGLCALGVVIICQLMPARGSTGRDDTPHPTPHGETPGPETQ